MPVETETRTPEQMLQVATILWAALTFAPLLAAVAFYFVRSSGSMTGSVLPAELAWAALAVAASASIAMVVLPPRIAPPRADVGAPALLVTRTILGCAIGESGALLSAVSYLLTGVELALLGVALFVAVSLSRRPSRDALESIEREYRHVAP